MIVRRASTSEILPEIEKWLDKFNSFYPYCAQDYIVSLCFERQRDKIPPPEDQDRRRALLSIRIEVLVWLFQISSLSRYRKLAERSPDELRFELATKDFGTYYWKTLIDEKLNMLSSLSEYNSFRDSKERGVNLEQIFRETLNHLLTEPGGKAINEPVFCSKLLHWTFPRVFPMMDRYVLKAIRDYGAKFGIGQVKKTPKDPTAKSAYRTVRDFYAWLEEDEHLSCKARKQLEKDDQSSQPAGLKVPNSWIRIVDKWLWLKGKGN